MSLIGAMFGVGAMDQANSTWRSSLWARWLGWTLVFLLVTAAGWLVDQAARMAFSFSLPASLPFLASVIAAFWIGQRFRSWWWVAGPLAALAVPAAGFALWTVRLMWEPQVSVETVWGPQTPQDSAEFILFFLIIGVAMLGVMYTAVAAAGVWWGRRRREPDPAPHRVDGQ
jgi:hypothetical protein